MAVTIPEYIAWSASGNCYAAFGDGWSAAVRPRGAGGAYEGVFNGFGQQLVWPAESEPGRTAERCKAWVRRVIVGAANRERWLAYIGRPSPKAGDAERPVPKPFSPKRNATRRPGGPGLPGREAVGSG